MKQKHRKKAPAYYDILINKEGGIIIQPFGEMVDIFLKKLKVPKKNTKLNIFCG